MSTDSVLNPSFIYQFNPTSNQWEPFVSASAATTYTAGDALDPNTAIPGEINFPHLYFPDSNTWARERGNFNGTLLASAARTATTSSAQQTNYNHRGVLIYINVTAIVATPSIVVNVQAVESVITGNFFTLLSSAAITATGQYMLHVYPGISEIANVKASSVLPKAWRVNVTHADADSITYSVVASLIV